MAWGNPANVTTTHLDSAADDPSQARVELYNALIELTAVINGRGSASGVAPLDASSKITATYLPDTIASSLGTDLTLSPNTGTVVIEDILALTAKTVTELAALDNAAGAIAYCSDGDAGQPCLAVSTGTQDSNLDYVWLRVQLGTQISAT